MGAVDAFLGGPPVEITPYELGAHLIRLRHGLDLLELRFARDAALFASTDEYESQGSTSPVDWVRHQCGMSGNAAARSIATGEQAESLPASVAALGAGRIGFAHLALLAGTARALAGPAAEPQFDERPLLALALEHSVSPLASTAPTPTTPAMPPGCSPSTSARWRTGASSSPRARTAT